MSERGLGGLTFDLLSVRRTRVMCVNLLALCVLVERDEAVEEVVAGGVVRVSAHEVGEVVHHGTVGELLGEEIDLVQEEDL